MSKAQSLVDEQVKAVSSICDLEPEVTQAFHAAMLPIAERHLSSLATSQTGGVSSGDGKIKIGKKTPAKRTTKPKEEKLSGKNAYHFFVADKMSEVKAAGVEAKSRMKRIGEMWKALNDAERQPYKDMADRYNAYVAKEMQTSDWKARKETIVLAANSSAKTGSCVTAPTGDELEVEVEATSELEEEDEQDTDSVNTVSTSVSVPVPVKAPVQAPVQAAAVQAAPVRRRAKTTK